MKNSQINRIATRQVAEALGDLNDQVIYVGGAVVTLYIDDPAADDVRPTKDIDISFQIINMGQLEEIREALLQRGFTQSAEDDVICRFRLQDKKVDVMSTQNVGWAPANRWFKPGFDHSFTKDVDGLSIRLMPLPYFLAAKFDAFRERGGKDARMSHDFEDIVYLLNYTADLTRQVSGSDPEVRAYLMEMFRSITQSNALQEAIIGNLYYEDQEVRFTHIMTVLQEITDGV